MTRYRPGLLACTLVALLAGCSGPTAKPAVTAKPRAAPPRAKTIPGPTQLKTPAGGTLQEPAGMVARQAANIIHLTDPERSVNLHLVELRQAKPDCLAAIEDAWAAVVPGVAFKKDQQIKPPPGDKWDEVLVVTYVRQGDNLAQAVAPHQRTFHNPEMGQLKFSAMKGGGYELDAGEFKTTLMRHDRTDGKSVLIFASPPLAGLNLIPVEGKPGQLEMWRAQEKYLFKRQRPWRTNEKSAVTLG